MRGPWWSWLLVSACTTDVSAVDPAVGARLASECVEGGEGTLWRFRAIVPDHDVQRVQVDVWQGDEPEPFELYPDPTAERTWSSEWRSPRGACPDAGAFASFHAWHGARLRALGEVEVVAAGP